MSKKKRYHYFYKITNLVNNHFYYGVHSTDDLDDGYMGSGKRLWMAYKKHGIGNFSKEILKFFSSAEEAYKHESEVVDEEMVMDGNCYNLVRGGKGNFLVQQHNSTSFKNHVVVKLRGTSKFFLISKDLYDPSIHDTTWSSHHHTLESRQKTRKSMKPSASGNSRVWVNKHGVVKYIKKELLRSYEDDNWELGRVGYKPRKNCQGKKILQ